MKNSLPDPNLKTNPVETLSTHARSFWWASLFFDRKSLERVAALYHLCRYVDDCADRLNVHKAQNILLEIRADLEDPKRDSSFQIQFKQLEGLGVKRAQFLQLLDGVESDLHEREIKSEEEYFQYCFQVAGVVGLMMLPLIGVDRAEAQRAAIDLGIAMQTTNICRDVLEDAQNSRVYLSKEKRIQYGLGSFKLDGTQQAPLNFKLLMQDRVSLAEEYYERGFEGLHFIPLRSRFVIYVAGALYRAIGRKIRQQGFPVLHKRVYLSPLEKSWVVAKVSVKFLFRLFYTPKKAREPVEAEFYFNEQVNVL